MNGAGQFLTLPLGNGCVSTWRVECVDVLDDRLAVIFEQLDMSLEQALKSLEILVHKVCAKAQREMSSIVWIEHYRINPAGVEGWELLNFKLSMNGQLTAPRSRPMTRDDWHELGLRARSA